MIRAWPREEAFEEELARQLTRGEACALSNQEVTWDGLLYQLAEAAGARPLDDVVRRLTFRRACREAAAATRLAQVAGTSGFLDAAERFAGACERAGLEPDEVAGAAAGVGGSMEERLRILADAYRRAAATLTANGAGASSDRRRAIGTAILRTGGARFDDVVIKPRPHWTAADVDTVIALAGCSRSFVVPSAGITSGSIVFMTCRA